MSPINLLITGHHNILQLVHFLSQHHSQAIRLLRKIHFLSLVTHERELQCTLDHGQCQYKTPLIIRRRP